MSLQNSGYMNKILRVDLTTEKIKTEELDEHIMPLILGGKGLASMILYNELAHKQMRFLRKCRSFLLLDRLQELRHLQQAGWVCSQKVLLREQFLILIAAAFSVKP